MIFIRESSNPSITQLILYKGENKAMKYIIVVFLSVVAAVAGYFGVRRLTHKDLAFTPLKRYASKLAKTLIHTEATAAQEAGIS